MSGNEVSVISLNQPSDCVGPGLKIELEPGSMEGITIIPNLCPGVRPGLQVLEIDKLGISVLLKHNGNSGKDKKELGRFVNCSSRDVIAAVHSPIETKDSDAKEEGWVAVFSTKKLEPGVTIAYGCVEMGKNWLEGANFKFPCVVHVHVGWYRVGGNFGPKCFFGNSQIRFRVHAWSYSGKYTIGGAPSQLKMSFKCLPLNREGGLGDNRSEKVTLTVSIGKGEGHCWESFWKFCNPCCSPCGGESSLMKNIDLMTPLGTRIVVRPLVQQVPMGDVLRFSEGDILEVRVYLVPFQLYRNIYLELSLLQGLVCESNRSISQRNVDTVIKRHWSQFSISPNNRIDVNGIAVAMHRVTFEFPLVSAYVMHMDKFRVKSLKHDLQIRCIQKPGKGGKESNLLAMCTFPLVIRSEGVQLNTGSEQGNSQ